MDVWGAAGGTRTILEQQSPPKSFHLFNCFAMGLRDFLGHSAASFAGIHTCTNSVDAINQTQRTQTETEGYRIPPSRNSVMYQYSLPPASPPAEEVRNRAPDGGVKRWFILLFRGRTPLLLTVLSSALFGITAWFTQATFSTTTANAAGGGSGGSGSAKRMLGRLLKVQFGSSLAILRVLQGLLSTTTTMGLMKVFELIQWALTGRHQGLRCLSLLSLSPSTGLKGTLGIIFSRQARFADRLWGSMRCVVSTQSSVPSAKSGVLN